MTHVKESTMRKFKKISALALGLVLAVGVGAGIGANRLEGAKAAENVSFTLNLTSLGGSAVLGTTAYDGGAERTATVNTIGIGSKAVSSNGANLQFQANNGVLYNTTALPGRLVSVVLTQTGTLRVHSLYGGSTSRLVNDATANYTVSDGTLVSTQSLTSTTWTIATGTDYTYFCISRGGNSSYVSSIVITYASESVEFGVLDHILLDHSSVKKTYLVGETFDAEGLIVTAVDEDDNEMEVIDWTTDYDGRTFVTSDIGTKQVTVAYTDTENDKTAYGNFDITIGEYVPVEGVISFGVANSEYKTSWTSADLSITKSVPEIGDLQFSEINNVRLNASPVVGSISIGGNSTTGGEFTITLPVGTYASSITFTGLSVGNDAKTPTLTINDKTSFVYSSALSTITLKPYDHALKISTLDYSRIWAESISITLKLLSNLPIDYAQHFLDTTSEECSLLDVKTATWNALSHVYSNLSAESKELIVLDSGNTTISEAVDRYVFIVNKYNYSDFMNFGLISPARGLNEVYEDDLTLTLIIAVSSIGITTLVSFYFLSKKKRVTE